MEIRNGIDLSVRHGKVRCIIGPNVVGDQASFRHSPVLPEEPNLLRPQLQHRSCHSGARCEVITLFPAEEHPTAKRY